MEADKRERRRADVRRQIRACTSWLKAYGYATRGCLCDSTAMGCIIEDSFWGKERKRWKHKKQNIPKTRSYSSKQHCKVY